MIGSWSALLQSGEKLLALYSAGPPLTPVRLRAVHLSRFGPAVTVRADFAEFPDRPLGEWAGLGLDTLQAHLAFGDVDDLRIDQLSLPAVASVAVEAMDRRRMRVQMSGDNCGLCFTATDTVLVGHVSAYRLTQGTVDDGPHQFVSRLDQRLYKVVPDPTAKPYHDHL